MKMGGKVFRTAPDNEEPPKFHDVTLAFNDSLTIMTNKVVLVAIKTVMRGGMSGDQHLVQ